MDLKRIKASGERFVNVLARIPFFYLLEIVYLFTAKEENSTLLGIFGYVFGLIGLFADLDLLLLFYGWLFQAGIIGIIFSLVSEVKNSDKGPSIIGNVGVFNYLDSVVSDNHFYGQIISATGLMFTTQVKWTHLGTVWTIILMLAIPFGVDLVVRPLPKVPQFVPYVCYVFLFLYSLYLIYKGLQLAAKCLKNTQQASNNFWAMLETLGWVPLVRHHWNRVEMSRVMVFLWWIKFALKVATQKQFNWFWLFASFGESINTIPNLLAASIVVCEISQSILYYTQVCLKAKQPDQADVNFQALGINEGVAFFLLNIQIGQVGGSEEHSLVISLVMFVTLSLLIQDAYEITEPVLAVLGVTYAGKLTVPHIRALIVSFLLLTLPCYLVYTICSTFTPGTWLFVIISNSVVTVVQVIGALSIYGLFVFNVHARRGWEDLDDYVYYINAVSKVFEFLVALGVVAYSTWSTITTDWSLVGTGIICLHAYFNVYSRALEGWNNFLLRLGAVRKVNSLQSATDEELERHNDVCSICFDEMKSAKVTKCNHFFHGICLRKWLYVQNKCPLCHTDITPND